MEKIEVTVTEPIAEVEAPETEVQQGSTAPKRTFSIRAILASTLRSLFIIFAIFLPFLIAKPTIAQTSPSQQESLSERPSSPLRPSYRDFSQYMRQDQDEEIAMLINQLAHGGTLSSERQPIKNRLVAIGKPAIPALIEEFKKTSRQAIKEDKKIYELLRKELVVYPV